MKEGNESYNVWIRDWTFLSVNYTGYHNSRLVHKQQPADSAAFADMWGTSSNLFKTMTRPQHSNSLKVNSSQRQEAISRVNWCIGLGSELMPKILTLELAEYLIKVEEEINMKCDVVWLFVWNGICQCKKKQTGKDCSCSKKIKLKILQRELHECIQQTLFVFIPYQ